MNLVCFSSNTGGGLICDLLNNNPICMSGYKTTNQEHSGLKILDTPTVQRTLHLNAWNYRVEQFKNTDKWFGTHYHPSIIPDLSLFDTVIAITTETRDSKLYRWLRYYHGWFKSHNPEWQESDSLDAIDRVRELSKDVFETFESHPGCVNIEFADIVNGSYIDSANLDRSQFSLWQQANPWLYTSEETWAVKRFCEAEWELEHKQPYRYL
jgi:hypothetical protein